MIPPLGCQGGGEAQMLSYVYLLKSIKDDGSYLGWTTDLARRLEAHNAGASHDTKSRGPWKLVGYETHRTPEEAKRRERALKRNPRMLALFKKRVAVRRPTTYLLAKGRLRDISRLPAADQIGGGTSQVVG